MLATLVSAPVLSTGHTLVPVFLRSLVLFPLFPSSAGVWRRWRIETSRHLAGSLVNLSRSGRILVLCSNVIPKRELQRSSTAWNWICDRARGNLYRGPTGRLVRDGVYGGMKVAVSKKTTGKTDSVAATALYSSKIIKASALLGDTKTLLSHWNTAETAQANLDRLRRENVFGKASRSRVQDILAIFRQRYLTEPDVPQALVALVRQQFPAASLDRVLFFHAARADRLIHDGVVKILVPMKAQGIIDIDVNEIQRAITEFVQGSQTSALWSEATLVRIVQGLLATLRDFGVLEGAVNKRIAPAYLPVEAFAYVAFYLKRHQPSGAKLVELPDWSLFFLPREGVERFLVEAHQRGLLEYHAAGTVVRLTFPAETLEEYANVLAQRSH
jgi:Putative inner membrane protein (DUF1819)